MLYLQAITIGKCVTRIPLSDDNADSFATSHDTSSGQNPKIALFLPMSGQGQVFGQAIMQGFMDAQKGPPQGPATQTAITPPPSSGNDVLDQIYEQVAATTGNAL